MALYVCHMMYLGREFIYHRGHGHTLATNWYTKRNEQDLFISSHHIVFMIMMMHDHSSNALVSLDTTGSNFCEDVCSLLCQEVKNMKKISFMRFWR